MIKIAMVEDDSDLAYMLTEYLKDFDIIVENFEDPYIGLSAIGLGEYDLVILDLTLPGLDGLELCKEILERYQLPVIISSARSDINDKIVAMELGADDYLPKPYDPRELALRIKTIMRRIDKYTPPAHKDIDNKYHFICDEEKREITKDGTPITFTAAEYAVMSLFIKRRGFIISRQEIVEVTALSQGIEANGGSIAVIINRIRHKIEDDPKQPQFLITIRGMGYKLDE
ncbi:MAG: response regulator transcription factor [Epsilonproteobacteria bacterium]|nr:response regulator transcription factor [Campylobacterota bacterium]